VALYDCGFTATLDDALVQSGCVDSSRAVICGPATGCPATGVPAHSPKQTPCGESARAVFAEEERTTLVLQRLPKGCSPAHLRRMLDSAGLAGRYDLVYQPASFATFEFFQFGMVNFVTHEDAEHALRQIELQNFEWPCEVDLSGSQLEEPIEVAWSEELHGMQAHIERYRNSPLNHEDVPEHFKPILLHNGVQIPFPRPTMQVRAPRVSARE